MFEYILYRIGYFLANTLPLGFCYTIASITSYLQFLAAEKDRLSVMNNLKVVTGSDEGVYQKAAQMYINFGMYLADFFRYSKIDRSYIEKNVKVVNREYVDEALKKGKGIIALTGHLGNWELGGVVTAMMGYKIAAVALPHKDKRVNDFFDSQRTSKNLEIIPIGVAVRRCFKVLKENRVVALLGDRDFSEVRLGLEMDFFGKKTPLPRGPAALALKTQAPIIPGFMIREDRTKYKLIFDQPIYPPKVEKIDDEAVRSLMRQYIPVLEKYIRKYPTQWFMFREFWT
jgi:KDO2-lipid IV(A) lauroyltransferase